MSRNLSPILRKDINGNLQKFLRLLKGFYRVQNTQDLQNKET